MTVFERFSGLDADIEDVADRERSLIEHRPERHSRNERQDEKRRPVVLSDIVYRPDGRMLHLCQRPGLASESLPNLRRKRAGSNHLDRDMPIEELIMSEIDRP